MISLELKESVLPAVQRALAETEERLAEVRKLIFSGAGNTEVQKATLALEKTVYILRCHFHTKI